MNEERFNSFKDISNQNGKYKDEAIYTFDKAKKPDSFFWPTKKSLDPFYNGTGYEKFYQMD